MYKRCFSILILVLTLTVLRIYAIDPPGIINYQGTIAVEGVPFDGTGSFKFALVDVSGTTTYWSNNGSSTTGDEPTLAVEMDVNNGRYSIPLGDTTFDVNMTNAIPSSVFADNADVRLRIWFDDGTNGFELLMPDQRLSSVGYALSASSAQTAVGVLDGSITSAKLADDAVIASKIADGAVTKLDSADGSQLGVVQVLNEGRVGIGVAADLSTPYGPFETGASASLSNLPFTVAVEGNFAYVVLSTIGGDALRVFDVSDRGNPIEVGTGTGLSQPTALAVLGDYVYLVDDGTNNLRVFDVSTPSSPLEVGASSGNLNSPSGVAVTGTNAYVVDFITQMLHVFDVSDPTNPTQTTISGFGLTSPNSVATEGDNVYVLSSTTGELHIFIASNQSVSAEVGSITGSGLSSANTVAVSGNYAYVVSAAAGTLHVFDVSNSFSPTEVAVTTGSGMSSPTSVAVAGNIASVTDISGGKLHVFDVSDPSNPIEVGTSMGSGITSPSTVAAEGNFAYVTDGGANKLHVFEVNAAAVLGGSLQLTQGGGVGFSDGSVQTKAFGVDAVTSNEIADGSIGSVDLESGALQWIAISGIPAGFADGTDDVNDADSNASNEIQSLSLFNSNLTISGANTVDLSPAFPWTLSVNDVEWSRGAGARARVESTVGSYAGFQAISGTVDYFMGVDGGGWQLFQNLPTAEPRLEVNASGDFTVFQDLITNGDISGTNITATGQVGIGTTSPSHTLTISNTTDAETMRLIGGGSFGSGARLNFGDEDRVYIDEPVDDRMEISATFGEIEMDTIRVGLGRDPVTNRLEVNGDASKTTSGSWLANSDRRIKTDIEEINGSVALEKLRAVRPVAFEYTPEYMAEHPSIDNRKYLNVVAQEFAAVFPDWVQSSGEILPGTDPNNPDNEIQQVDTWPLTIYSAAAIKELDGQNARLERENAELRERLDAIEQQLGSLLKATEPDAAVDTNSQ